MMTSEENFGTKKGARNEIRTEAESVVQVNPYSVELKEELEDDLTQELLEAPLLLLGPADCIKEDPELNLELEETENDGRSHRLATSCQGRRISNQQRELMLDFMMKHPALAIRKLTLPGEAVYRQQHLKELATMLNSLPNGVAKSEDKWLKSWQDWRSDVKTKKSNSKLLTPLEQKLLGFLGLCVCGHEEVPDSVAVAHQDSGRDLISQTDREEEGPVDENDCIDQNTSLHQDILSPAREGSTTTSAAADVSPGTVPPTSAAVEENVPSPSGRVPTSHDSKCSCTSTRTKKRKRSMDGFSARDEDPLVTIAREQLICLQEKNTFRRVQLQLDERKTTAIENASVAFIGVMKALEEYLRHKKGDN